MNDLLTQPICVKRLFCATIAALLLCGCSEPAKEDAPVELPPVPQISVADLDDAVKARFTEAQQKLAQSPRDGHYNASFAKLLHAYSLYQPAAVMYERCRLLRPANVECPYLEALTRREQGDVAAAERLLTKLLERKPDFPRASVVLADLYYQRGNSQPAYKLFAEAVNADSKNLEAVYGLAMTAMELGETDRARKLLEQLHSDGRNFGIVHAALATLARRAGDKSLVEFHTSAAARFADSKIPFVDSLLWAVQDEQVGDRRLVREARTLFEQGKIRQAATAYVKATVANPDNVSSHTSLIGIYGQLGNVAGAERHFKQSRALNQTGVSPLVAMGTVYMKAGSFDKARDLFAQAVELKPTHAEARTLGAYCSELLGEQADTAAYLQALKDDPTQSLAHYLLGRNTASTQSCAQALPHLRESVRLENKQTPAFMAELVRCLVVEGDLDQARARLASGFELAQHYGNQNAMASLQALQRELSSKLEAP